MNVRRVLVVAVALIIAGCGNAASATGSTPTPDYSHLVCREWINVAGHSGAPLGQTCVWWAGHPEEWQP